HRLAVAAEDDRHPARRQLRSVLDTAVLRVVRQRHAHVLAVGPGQRERVAVERVLGASVDRDVLVAAVLTRNDEVAVDGLPQPARALAVAVAVAGAGAEAGRLKAGLGLLALLRRGLLARG